MKHTCYLLLLGIAAEGLAQDVAVPHVFQAGTPARAAQVNENFATLVDAANINRTAIESLIGGTPEPIGTLTISTDPYLGQPISVVGFQWNGTSTQSGGGAGGGGFVLSFSPITIVKPVDGVSPLLFRDFGTGKFFQSVQIDLISSSSVATRYVLDDARISDLGTSAVGAAADLFDTVSFIYRRLTISTTDPATNTATTVCFDVQVNSLC